MITQYVFNFAVELWAGKWKASIRWCLKDGPLRFSELRSKMPDCSVKVLSKLLDGMEKNGIVIRKQYATIPVKVTYELSESAKPLLMVMQDFLYVSAEFMVENADILNIPHEKVEEIRRELLTMK